MFLKLVIAIFLSFISTAAIAGGVSENNNSGTTSTSGTVVPGGSANGASNAASSQRSDDQKGSQVNNLMGMMNFAMSAVHFSICAACSVTPCPSECVLGALHAAMGGMNTSQSGAHRAAGGIAGQSFRDVTSAQCSAGSCSSGGGEDVGINDPTNTKATMEALKKLEKLGVKVDTKKGKVTYKDKTYDMASITTPSGFGAAGGTSEDFATAMAANALAEKKALEKVGGITAIGNDLSGGGAPVAAAEEVVVDENGLNGQRGSGKKPRERNPTSVAGLSRDYNGDRIGVAADNIFLMIKRRYESRDKQNNFITNDVFAAPKSLKK